jgi:hypothetical protein
MRARLFSFAVGFWLIVAPLTLGYRSVTAILHDVAIGLLVCVIALAAIDWPPARFALAAPAIWLVASAGAIDWGARVPANHLACGVGVLLLALVPGGRVATARSAAKMAA